MTSHNIFIEVDKLTGIQVIVGDLEVNPFLKYASLIGDYQIASVWSSPEVLKAQKIMDFTKEMDIYSYGIILW